MDGATALPSGDDLAALVESRAVDQSAAARLQAAIGLGREVNESADALIERFVTEGRAAGLSWTEIGALFGTSKQAAQKRYSATTSDSGAWPGRWTPAARHVLDHAVQQAQALDHDYVGTEHLLLALLTGPGGVATQVLRDMGVSRDRVFDELPGPCPDRPTGDRKVMPRFKQALEYSQRIARALGQQVADTEHLLAGVLAVPDALAVEILKRQNVSATDARAALAQRLDVDPQLLIVAPKRRRRLVARS